MSRAHAAMPLRFTWMECSGALGDLGLFIPLVVAMTISCGLNIGIVLIMAGLMNILTGWLFRQPIPVQPMKAIAAVVITERLMVEEMVAAGLLIGVILLMISGVTNKISRTIPKPVVRGIQLGIGLKLVLTGGRWVMDLPVIGWDSMMLALIVIVLLIMTLHFKQPVLLYLFLGGVIILYGTQPSLFHHFSVQWPVFEFHWPNSSAWSAGFIKGVLPQLPLTLLNSVVAVCALSAQYFPGYGASPKKMAASVGMMNLISVPLGGIPMCHGSGGLAAQYRFGARTGGSVILLGVFKIIVGVVFGGVLLVILQNYPMAILGSMLMFAGLELVRSAQDMLGSHKAMIITGMTAVIILIHNTWTGFLAGMMISLICFNFQLRKS